MKTKLFANGRIPALPAGRLASAGLSLILFLPVILSAQNNYFMFSIGGGKSTLGGYSTPLSFAYERNHNKFTLRMNYNHQTGNKFPVFVPPVCDRPPSEWFGGDFDFGWHLFDKKNERYNDDFLGIGLLYGRTYRKSNWFIASASAGIERYRFKDREKQVLTYICVQDSIPVTVYQPIVTKTTMKNFGIALQADALFILNEVCGLGISVSGNINRDKSIVGLALNLVIGNLREE